MLIIIGSELVAQSLIKDSGFNTGETWDTGHGIAHGFVNTIHPYPDGRFLVGGQFDAYNHQPTSRLMRFFADGSVDTTFQSSDGIGPIQGLAVQSLALQPDGRIVVAGSFYEWAGLPRSGIVRLLADGTIDSTFNPGIGMHTVGPGGYRHVYDLELQPDGRILAAGWFAGYNGVLQAGLVRIMPDGQADTTFQPAMAGGTKRSLALLPDGRILVASPDVSIWSSTVGQLTLLHPDGSVDTTFQFVNDPPSAFHVVQALPDGRFIAGGQVSSALPGSTGRLIIVDATGAVDSTLSTVGVLPHAVTAVRAEADSGFIVAMARTDSHLGFAPLVMKVNAAGQVDVSFQPVVVRGPYTGGVRIEALHAIDGSGIWVGGNFTSLGGFGRSALAKLLMNGQIAPVNKPSRSSDFLLRACLERADGGIYVLGTHHNYQDHAAPYLSRIHSNGEVDTTFLSLRMDSPPLAMAFQSDGKLVVVGGFHTVRDSAHRLIVRLDTDGTVDDGFISGGDSYYVSKIDIYPDDRILIAGNFTSFNGLPANRIARLLPDGSPDPTFIASGPGPSSTPSVYKVAVGADGKAVLSGEFSTFNGVLVNRIVRLLPNGTVDASFQPSFQGGQKYLVTQLPDGRYLVCEQGGSCPCRLVQVDGTFSNGFCTGSGTNGELSDAVLLPDGRFLISGWFTQFDGQPANGLVVIDESGAVDPQGLDGVGPDHPYLPLTLGNTTPWVDDIEPLNDGGFLICGYFITYNGEPTRFITKLRLDNETTSPGAIRRASLVVPNPSAGIFTVPAALGSSISVMSAAGLTVLEFVHRGATETATVNLSAASKGLYVIHVRGEGQTQAHRVVVE